MRGDDPRINDLIKSEHFHHFDGTTTVTCVIVTHSGQQLVGHSISGENVDFDLEEGKRRARKFCVSRLAGLESYRERADQAAA